jgi:ABC-type dipeptide/oligopeptide/nickel transport system permease component
MSAAAGLATAGAVIDFVVGRGACQRHVVTTGAGANELRRRASKLRVSLAVFIIRRVLWTVPLLLLVMLATFALMRGSGGDPFRPPEGYSGVPGPLQRELEAFYHLHEPWFVEFVYYVKNVFTFNFGPSMVQRDLDINDLIRVSFPVTLELVLLATALAVPLGISLGVLAATHRNTAIDFLATSTASLLLVVPVFFVSYVCSRYLVLEWHLVPAGWAGWDTKVLPALSLALAPTGYIARLIRAAVVETLQEDFVRTARAKGLQHRRIIWLHVLKNSLVPLLSAAVPMLALLITGAFFVESSFGIPGASRAFIEGALTRDYPMIMGMTSALAVVVLAANLLADILLAMIDPRMREATPA